MTKLTESRRSTATVAVDTDVFLPFYGRNSVYASFTDDGDFEEESLDDRKNRPEGIVGYPINDIVGRRVKSSTYYARVFRYRGNTKTLKVSQYSHGRLNSDFVDVQMYYEKVNKNYADHMDVLFEEASSKAVSNNPFSILWYILEEISKTHRGSSGYAAQWAFLLESILGYDSVLDDRATGNIVQNRQDAIIILDSSGLEDLGIERIQKHKEDMNRYINRKVDRFNSMTRIVSARRRVGKF